MYSFSTLSGKSCQNRGKAVADLYTGRPLKVDLQRSTCRAHSLRGLPLEVELYTARPVLQVLPEVDLYTAKLQLCPGQLQVDLYTTLGQISPAMCITVILYSNTIGKLGIENGPMVNSGKGQYALEDQGKASFGAMGQAMKGSGKSFADPTREVLSSLVRHGTVSSWYLIA